MMTLQHHRVLTMAFFAVKDCLNYVKNEEHVVAHDSPLLDSLSCLLCFFFAVTLSTEQEEINLIARAIEHRPDSKSYK